MVVILGEMKAAIFSMAVFVLVIFPALLFVGIESLHQHSFMKHTTELTEIVRQDGGVSPRIQEIESRLEARGYEIEFKSDGQPVNGRVGYGKHIDVSFKYTYDSPLKVWGLTSDGEVPKRVLTTVNTVHNMRR